MSAGRSWWSGLTPPRTSCGSTSCCTTSWTPLSRCPCPPVPFCSLLLSARPAPVAPWAEPLTRGRAHRYDIKNRRTLLKRSDYPAVTPAHLFIGSELTVYSRKLKITAYGDEFTKGKLEAATERTVATVPMDALPATMTAVTSNGLRINNMKTVPGDSGKAVAIEVVGAGAIATYQGLGCPGTCSDSAAAADSDAAAVFGGATPSCASGQNCSLALVLPHAVVDGHAGAILDKIGSSGLEISCVQQFSLGRANAAEFLEVYKGVVPEYQKKVIELTAGPVVAVEVCGEDAVAKLREVAGPHDPDIARVVRPGTVRADCGIDKVQNAMHVTDLPEDGQLEVEYFFSMLASNC